MLLRVPLTRNSGTGLTVPDTEVNCLTMPDPNCCRMPEPEPSGPDDNTVDVRRDLIDCMLDDSRNGTLLDVLGMEPPCFWEYNKGDFFGRLVKGCQRGRFVNCELCDHICCVFIFFFFFFLVLGLDIAYRVYFVQGVTKCVCVCKSNKQTNEQTNNENNRTIETKTTAVRQTDGM